MAGGPSVKVTFLSDFSKLKSGISDVASSAKSGAGTLKDAFAPALAVLNKSGVLGPFKEALDGIGDSVSAVVTHIHDIPLALAAAGAGVAGVGVALSALGSSDQAAHQQLQAAVAATGKSYDDYASQVDAAIKHQETFGNTAVDTQNALAKLTEATNDPAKALSLLNTATDLAAAKHESLTGAAGQLAKAYNGNTRILKEFGVAVGTSATAATKALETATRGASTADQKAADAKQHLTDLTARLAAGNKAQVVSTAGVTSAQNKLADAQRHLSDLEAEDAGKKKLTISQQLALRDAHTAVTRAIAGVSSATDKYKDAQAAAIAKTHLSVAQQQELRDAQRKVVDSSAAAVAAHKKLTDAQATAGKAAHTQADEMTSLGNKLKGQAAAAADTFTGKLKEMRAKIEDNVAAFGQKYGPALQGAGAAMAGLGAVMKIGQSAMEAAKAAALGTRIELMALSAWEKITAAAQWALNVAMDANPITLVVLAIVALIAVIVLVLVKTGLLKDAWNDMKAAAEAVWKAILAAVKDTWNWIKTNWPLLLAILTGPIGLAVLEIQKHWTAILNGIKGVWSWIKSTWQQVYSFIVTPVQAAIRWIAGAWAAVTNTIGGVVSWIRNTWNTLYSALTSTISRAVGWITGAWGAITSAVRGVVSDVEGIFNGLVSWFAGLPQRIANIASHAFDSIGGAAKGAVNAAIGLWNEMASHTALHISVGIPHLPKINVNTPQLIPDIPKLAQGGLITETGLILAHAGEAITPLPSKAMGPAVNVEKAYFSTEMDVDLFMKRAAWLASTRAV